MVTSSGATRAFRVLVASGVAAAIAAAIVTVATRGATNYTEVSFTDPGRGTSIATAILRTVADITGAVTVGALVFAVVCVTPSRAGRLAVDGYRALALAQKSSAVWAGAALVLTPLSAANTVGQPIGALLSNGQIGVVITQTLPSRGWLVATLLAIGVAVGTRLTLSWTATVGVATLAGLALLPPVVVGNAGEGLGHDVSTTAVIVHVLAAAVWIGGAIAAGHHLLHGGASTAVTRFRWLSLACAASIAVSGIALAANLQQPGQLFSTQYGLLVVLKTLLLVPLVAGTAWLLRRPAVAGRPGTALMSALGAPALLLACVGLSVGMAQQPAPQFLVTNPTPSEQQIGYSLPRPPGLETFALDWRFDLLLGSASVVMAALYLIGVRQVRRRGGTWPVGRTVSFVAGCATLLIVTSSGVTAYAEAVFSLHMVVHMSLNMLVPILWVLGGPVLLITAAARPRGPDDPPGLPERVSWLTRSAAVRLLTHPVGGIALFAAALFGLYLTPIFGYAVGYHWFHELMNLLFLVSGYFLFWQIIGIDPLPHRLPHLGRLGMLIALMPVHALFGVAILARTSVMGLVFYGYLYLPWLHDQLADQRLGGLVVWIGGELPLLLTAVVLLVQWRRADEQSSALGPGGDPMAALWAELDRERNS